MGLVGGFHRHRKIDTGKQSPHLEKWKIRKILFRWKDWRKRNN